VNHHRLSIVATRPFRLALLGVALAGCGPTKGASPAPARVGAARPGVTKKVPQAPVEVVSSGRPATCLPPGESADAAPALTPGSVRLLGTLRRPVHVDFYAVARGPELDAYVRSVARLLCAYQLAGSGNFEFKVLDSDTEALRQSAKEAGVNVSGYGDGERRSTGLLGIALRYGKSTKVIPQLFPESAHGLEFWLSNKVREIRDLEDGIVQRVGVLAGKAEIKLTDPHLVPNPTVRPGPSILGIIEQAFPYYSVDEVDLKASGGKIDDALTALIVTQPGAPYTDSELRALDEFLMRGGRALVVYASAVTLKAHDASMRASVRATGLERLLSGYGIQMNTDAVFDFHSPLTFAVTNGNGMSTVTYPGVARVQRAMGSSPGLDSSFAPFFLMDEVMFPFPSSLTLLPNRQPSDVKIRSVASTTSQSSLEVGGTLNLLPTSPRKPKGPLMPRIVAAVAEGRLRSAFVGASPTSGDRRAPSSSRVLVVSSGLFLTNPFVYSLDPDAPGEQMVRQLSQPYTKHLTSTILSFKNTLDWLTGDADLVEASSKLLDTAGPTSSDR
jgi:hypothetical protein